MNIIEILSIDPGSNTGLSITRVDIISMRIKSIESWNINLNTIVESSDDKHIFMVSKLQKIKDIVTDVMVNHSINILAIENAFLNSKFPLAVMQLSQIIATIELSVKAYNPLVGIMKYSPMSVKKGVGASRKIKGKDSMMIAVLDISEITKHINPRLLTEHQVDSIAVMYSALIELRNNPSYLFEI